MLGSVVIEKGARERQQLLSRPEWFPVGNRSFFVQHPNPRSTVQDGLCADAAKGWHGLWAHEGFGGGFRTRSFLGRGGRCFGGQPVLCEETDRRDQVLEVHWFCEKRVRALGIGTFGVLEVA